MKMIFLEVMMMLQLYLNQNPKSKLKNRNLKLLQNQLLYLMLKYMILKQIWMNSLKEFWILFIQMVLFGTMSQRNQKLHSVFSNFKWDVLLKMIKSSLMISSIKLKNGKKFNQSIWLACKNYDAYIKYKCSKSSGNRYILLYQQLNIVMEEIYHK